MADMMTVELEGLMLEKLITLALSDGAVFTHIVRLTRRRISVTAAHSSIRALRVLAEKYHIGFHVVHAGFRDTIKERIRSRITLPAALITAAALTALFITRIWTVDIVLLRGDNAPDGIQEILESENIHIGAAWQNADMQKTALKLASLEGCAHASLRREGVAAVIEIACEEPVPGIYDISEPADLVAAYDGVIASVNVKSGTAMVKPGDTVRKGQILISGTERMSAEETTIVGALGSVTARIWITGDAQAETALTEKLFTGRESAELSLVLPWISLELAEAETYSHYAETHDSTPVGGLFVPIELRRTVRSEYIPYKENCDTEELKIALEAASTASAMAKMAQNTYENAEIIDKWTDFSMIELDILYARTTIEFECEIAVTRGHLEGN